MADILNFYTDIDLKDIALSVPVGVASIVKTEDETKPDLTKLSNWISIGQYTYDSGYYRKIYRLSNIDAQSGITLGGTGAIATVFSPENWVTGDTPKLIDGTFRNAFFIDVHDTTNGAQTPVWRGIYLQIFGGQYKDNNDIWHFSPTIRIGNYLATPDNKITIKADRTSYKYYTGTDYEFAAEASANGWTSNSQFNQIAMYSCVVEETEFFMFVMGVNNGVLHPSNDVTVVLIPKTYFKYRIPKPYIGPVSKESAESAFITGSRSKESVLPRDLSVSPNPYGFNRNGVYLCKCDRDSYNKITSKIYNGLSGNYLNALGQVVSGVIVGNSRRPRDEVQTMVNGVLCCHAVPVLGGFPSTGSVAMTSICGYSMFAPDEMTLQTVDPIQHETITTGIIPRQTGNFLDFAPYTNVSLSIPILGTVQIDPSAILGRSLSLHFGMDVFAGVLSCDVSIIEPDGTSWIYTTLQANCGTDMQIMGSGANGNPILKLANALTDGQQSPLAGIFSAYDGLQTCSYSTPINRISHTGANLLLSPYAIYLTVTTPNNSNAADFWTLAGIPSHMSGTVGDFTGRTVFEHVDLSAVSGATDSELSEIENTLRGGVWL